ncbi:MAG: hypothetical protein K0R90_1277 [Oscillospiraceae bacterium]|jgi:hypothetical protein|nr:hypothetical protein [Oscillospiraceae bacterium]
MKKLKIKALQLLKDNKGTGELIGGLIGVLVIISAFFLGLEGYKLAMQYMTLDSFANEISKYVAMEGSCGDSETSERLANLKGVTTLNPTITYAATFINSRHKTVQYGDTIKVTVQIQTTFLSSPVTLVREKSVVSQKYWK